MHKFFSKALIILIFTLATGCVTDHNMPHLPSSSTSSPHASIEAKQVAAQLGSSYVTEVEFSPGLSKLSSKAKIHLKKLKKQWELSSYKKIEKIHVIVWADEEYPSIHTEKLPQTQIDLAESRGKTLVRALSEMNLTSAEVVNMALRPSFWDDLINSDDERIKSALEVVGVPNTDTSVKIPSKKGHGMVLILTR